MIPRRPRNASGRRRDQRRRTESGASDVLGTILMVAITVIAAAGLAALVSEFPKPTREKEVDLSIEVSKGAGTWGTGDERVLVKHRGGEPLLDDETTIVVRIGASTNRYTGDGLLGAFADGKLSLGEEWESPGPPYYTIYDDSLVDVDVLLAGEETQQLAATTTLETPCADDLTPPSVTSWTQGPADVDVNTVGAVTITATITDDCSGVDATLAPNLQYRLNDGTNPAWTDLGDMTDLAGDDWQRAIPDPTWASHSLETLEYKITGLVDDRANIGDSEVRADIVNPAPIYFDAVVGQNGEVITNFNNAQSASDGGLESDFAEASTGSSPVTSDRFATGVVSSGALGATNAIGAPDDARAQIDNMNEYVQTSGFSGATGSITKVELAFEGHYTGSMTDDRVRLFYRVSAGPDSGTHDFVPTLNTDALVTKDVTSLRSWSWSDITNTDVTAKYIKTGALDGAVIEIDSLWLIVTYTETTYNMSVRTTFVSVPAGNHELQLRYRVSGDTFRVQVWDGTAWNVRGVDLTSTTATTWSYAMTSAEYNAGAPKVRFVDVTPGATQGHLYLDYGRVRTS